MRKKRKKVRLKKLPTDHTRRTEPFFQSQVPYLRASIFSLPYSYSPDNHWDNSDVEQRVKVRLYCICVASLCCSYYSTKFPPLFVLHLRTDPQFSFFFSLHYKLLRAGFTKLSSFPLGCFALRLVRAWVIYRGVFRILESTATGMLHISENPYLTRHFDRIRWQLLCYQANANAPEAISMPWNLFYNVCPCPSLK